MPTFTAVIERKQDDLPRFIVLGFDPNAAWGVSTTTLVTGRFGGVSFERRSIVPWGDGRWFLQVTGPMAEAAGVDTGDMVEVELALPSHPEPDDLLAALTGARVTGAWERLHLGSRRDLILQLCEAKTPATREKRIAEILERVGAPY